MISISTTKEEIGSTDIKEMVESDFDLTIYTCTNDNLRRVTVRCNRVYSKGQETNLFLFMRKYYHIILIKQCKYNCLK